MLPTMTRLTSRASAEFRCDATMRHVIFGYGSLICPKSRATTAPSLVNVVAEPAIVANIERSWCVRVVTVAATAAASSSSSSCSNNDNNSRDAPATTATTTKQQQASVRRIGFTPVGVQFKHGAECNGVLIHITEDELQRFDEREGKFYTRRRIVIADIRRYYDNSCDDSVKKKNTNNDAADEDDVKCSVCKEIFEMAAKQHNNSSAAASILSSSSAHQEHNNSNSNNNNNDSNNYNDIAVWIYVPKIQYTAYANTSCPIIQSYIDIIIRGCLSISHDFAKQFLLTTHGWSSSCGGDDDTSDNNEEGDATNKTVVRSDEEEAGSTTNTTNSSSSNVGSSCHYNNNMWVNDRSLPIYTRADIDYSLIHGQLIDELIEEYHKIALQHRIDI
jgi:cation transport regulator ChaC